MTFYRLMHLSRLVAFLQPVTPTLGLMLKQAA